MAEAILTTHLVMMTSTERDSLINSIHTAKSVKDKDAIIDTLTDTSKELKEAQICLNTQNMFLSEDGESLTRNENNNGAIVRELDDAQYTSSDTPTNLQCANLKHS